MTNSAQCEREGLSRPLPTLSDSVRSRSALTERRRASLSELSAEKSERRGELLEAFTAGEDSHGTCLKDRPKRESTRKKAAPVPRMSIQRGNECRHLRAGGCAAAVAIGSQKFLAPHSLPPPGPTDVTI